MAHDYHDQYIELCAKVSMFETALRDIAGSEEIPTPSKAWEFCRDVARAALQSAQE